MVGVISLLVALLLPPLQQARYQAMRVQCMARLQQLGQALNALSTDHKDYFPYWDDGAQGVRFTWVDILVQHRYLGDYRIAYCPDDLKPDPINQARGRAFNSKYPGSTATGGIDYSYGISVTLAAGGWNWAPGYNRPNDDRQRRFENHLTHTAQRVISADSNWSSIYNLSGDYLKSFSWNDPTWYSNTIAWRHLNNTANMLMQDGHVDGVRYQAGSETPINTSKYCVWYPGEPVHVGPDSKLGMNYYPDTTPPRFDSTPPGDMFPSALLPSYYTQQRLWTMITHK
ncbi:MAG: hypothetical protein CHACPFDD_01711 [Phycisphaerae bacterium]|nr:hypothetical protein [Phycisphaerae bacterium]